MRDVEYLSKDDKVEFGNTKYKAISEEKVTRAVRDSLIKNGIVIIPIEQEHSREGNLSSVDTKYKIQNIENVDDYIIAVSSGTGADTQDKGVGKAMTYAYKYLLLRTFAIPTGEDPDKISSAELDDKEKNKKISQSQAKVIDGLATSADADKGEILNYYKVNSFNDMTQAQYENCVAMLNKKLTKRAN